LHLAVKAGYYDQGHEPELELVIQKKPGQPAVVNYVRGANIGGFIKVADAMLDQGVV
jgi:hypothetical protein